MRQSHKDLKRRLNKQLSHAFRYGTSAFRYGMVPEGISDHLPITASLPCPSGKPMRLLSWNLLAEDHLFNNFRNVSGIQLLEDAISQRIDNNIYAGGFMYHFYAELSQFLLKKSEGNNVTITREGLEKFVSTESQPSRRARSRDPETAKMRTQQVESARRVAVDLLLNEQSTHAHEYRLSLKHCMELIFHIKGDEGVLKWENRFKKLAENTKAVAELKNQDIIALQECTSPADIERIIDRDNMQFITHNLSRTGVSSDNVVLAFDRTKYKPVGEPVKSNFHKQKPAVYCKLEEHSTGKQFIVGSIHHPGGEHDLRHEILENVKALQNGNDEMPYYIAGDYNHTAVQFLDLNSDNDPLKLAIYYPSAKGTMAGSDYGNTNQAIDGVLSNQDLHKKVDRSRHVQLAQRATQSIDVIFASETKKNLVVEGLLKPVTLSDHSMFAKSSAEPVRSALTIKHDDSELGERQPMSIGL